MQDREGECCFEEWDVESRLGSQPHPHTKQVMSVAGYVSDDRHDLFSLFFPKTLVKKLRLQGKKMKRNRYQQSKNTYQKKHPRNTSYSYKIIWSGTNTLFLLYGHFYKPPKPSVWREETITCVYFLARKCRQTALSCMYRCFPGMQILVFFQRAARHRLWSYTLSGKSGWISGTYYLSFVEGLQRMLSQRRNENGYKALLIKIWIITHTWPWRTSHRTSVSSASCGTRTTRTSRWTWVTTWFWWSSSTTQKTGLNL